MLVAASGSVIKNKATFFLFFFVVFVIIDQQTNKNPMMDGWGAMISNISIFIWSALANYFKKKQKYYFKIIRLILVFTFITVVISFFWSLLLPNLVRETVSEDHQDLLIAYSKLGLMSYGFAHALPLLLPFIIFMAKNESKKMKILLFFAVLLSLALLFQASITTSFFLGIVISIVAFFLNVKNTRQFVKIVILGFIVIVFVGKTIAIASLEFIQPYSVGAVMDSKVEDLLISIKHGELVGQEVEVRAEHQELSLNSFINNFLLGCQDKDQTGGHSFFVDYLAQYGLIGFSPFLFFIYLHLKVFILKTDIRVRPYFILSVCYFVVISFLKGRPLLEMFSTLLFVIPGLGLYVSYRYCNIVQVQKLNF
jgi:hypothetical protein